MLNSRVNNPQKQQRRVNINHLSRMNRREKQVLCREEGWYQWKGEGDKESGSRVNAVQKMCTLVCKCNNDTC
jgi:hypothetical protein